MSENTEAPVCGVVMPISAMDGCGEGHWIEVLSIVTSAIESAGFSANLVSNGDEVGIIHKRIIQNLYDNPIVVCDVSAKNPNVMFELGMRLAFDKPTIIIKDDQTSYSFDTAPIEHLEYPRDLRFSKIVEFRERLASKVKATHAKAQNDPSYTPFLKHFGEFKVARIEKEEVSGQEFILEELRNLRVAIQRSEQRAITQRKRHDVETVHPERIELILDDLSSEQIERAISVANDWPAVLDAAAFRQGGKVRMRLLLVPGRTLDEDELRTAIVRSTQRGRVNRFPVIPDQEGGA